MSLRKFVIFALSIFLSMRAVSAELPLPSAGSVDYGDLASIMPSIEAQAVNAFVQDEAGMMWICSNKGLLSYDGYVARPYFNHGESSFVQIHDAVLDGDIIYLGTDRGVLVFDTKTGKYIPNSVLNAIRPAVRAIAKTEKYLWFGGADGIKRYDIKTGVMSHCKPGDIERNTVYDIYSNGTDVYVGTVNGLFIIKDEEICQAETVKPVGREADDLFIYSIDEDNARNCLWIGTSKGLWKYTKSETGDVLKCELDRDVLVNDVIVDREGTVVLGTDEGFCLYREGREWWYERKPRETGTLVHNYINALFCDRDGNVWMGTRNGISLATFGKGGKFFSISGLSGMNISMNVTSAFVDDNDMWLGGTSGLLHVGLDSNEMYTVNKKAYPLPNNSVRNIFQDNEGVLWITTDDGIVWYDNAKEHFNQVKIVTDLKNVGWTICMEQDNEGRLWVGTFATGIFVLDRKDAMDDGVATPVMHLTSAVNFGQSFMMEKDSHGRIWTLYYDRGLDYIDVDGTVHRYDLVSEIGDKCIPTAMTMDGDWLWCGYWGGILRINTVSLVAETIPLYDGSLDEIVAMEASPNAVWLSTTRGQVWMVDKKSLRTGLLSLPMKPYYSLEYIKESQTLLLGSSDGVMMVSLPLHFSAALKRSPVFTSVLVNGRSYEDGAYSIRDIKESGSISVPFKRNNVTVSFSSLTYSFDGQDNYAWKIDSKGSEGEWETLPDGANTISFAGLSPGRYTLSVGMLAYDGTYGSDVPATLHIRVRPPVYMSPVMLIIYVLLLGVLFLVAVLIYRRHAWNVRVKREKELVKNQLNSKVESFSRLSGNVRVPLNNILGPIEKLRTSETDPARMDQLDKIWYNVLAVHSLVGKLQDDVKFVAKRDKKLVRQMAEDDVEEVVSDIEVKKEPQDPAQSEDSSNDEKFLVELTSIIEENIDSSELNVTFLADEMHISSRQLSRKMKAITGYSTLEYIKKIRINKAAAMLSGGHFSVSEVMYSVGFTDPSYFAKCFSAMFGCTPGKFSKK